MCPNNDNILTKENFECIGDIARHCDNQKLCIAVDESRIFDMSALFCDNWQTALDIIKEVLEYQTALAVCEADPECDTPPTEPENYAEKLNFVCGGSFDGCNGKQYTHLGALRVWVYYAYARYVIINPYTDTPNGLVSKTNEYSIPTPLKEYLQIADRYKTMGYEAFKMMAQFMKQSDLFEESVCFCSKCGGTKAMGYGAKGGIIRKKI